MSTDPLVVGRGRDWIWTAAGNCTCSDRAISHHIGVTRRAGLTTFECGEGVIWQGVEAATPKRSAEDS